MNAQCACPFLMEQWPLSVRSLSPVPKESPNPCPPLCSDVVHLVQFHDRRVFCLGFAFRFLFFFGGLVFPHVVRPPSTFRPPPPEPLCQSILETSAGAGKPGTDLAVSPPSPCPAVGKGRPRAIPSRARHGPRTKSKSFTAAIGIHHGSPRAACFAEKGDPCEG